MTQKYSTAPVATTKMPSGIKYIIGNEAAERFSFYGMRTILVIFMTEHLMSSTGTGHDLMTGEEANEIFHWFVASAYFFPIIGAMISDAVLGKYKTILFLSIVYCLGHLCLAIDDTRFWLFSGLILIAVGTGAIKPCVSAHVGDQFGKSNQHLLSKVFSMFYFSINLGAAASTFLTPILLKYYGPAYAFGVPGILMAIATLTFWLGRNKFVHIPPAGIKSVRENFQGDGLRAIKNLFFVYVFVAMFWSLFDQTGSAWVLQAKRMDRTLFGSFELLPSQIQAANPILILIFIPLFALVIYPAINRVFPLTPLRKVSIGFFLTIPAFCIPAWIDHQINGGQVLTTSSNGDSDLFPVERLFDGKANGPGWVSGKLNKDELGNFTDDAFPQKIVVRLRERRAWEINQVRFNPFTDIDKFLTRVAENEETTTAIESKTSFAKEVEVFVANTRRGDLKVDQSGKPVLNEDGEKQYEWTRSLGTTTLVAQNEGQPISFDSVSAEYLQFRIHSNFGGDYVALGEIEVLATGELPADAHEQAKDVWPNVALTGYQPNISWQLLAYIMLTAAEIMVSITCLEFSYTQAPNKMKSFIMALYLLSVSAGNVFTALVNKFIQNDDKSSKLEGPSYYWFFTGVITLAAFGFIFVAKYYRGTTHIQDEGSAGNEPDTTSENDSAHYDADE